LTRRSQAQAIRPAVARKPTAVHKATGPPRPAAASNRSLAGPPNDLASVVQQARAAPRVHVPHASAVALDFGLPISALEIRAGTTADAACRLLNARAFAVQNLVFFADPRPSLALVRHEFAHVVQQDGVLRPAPAQYQPGSLNLGAAGSEIERQAAAAAAGYADALKRGAPIAVQRNGLGDEPDRPSDDDRSALRRAEQRLRDLAVEIELKTFESGKESKFGVVKAAQADEQTAESDEPEFDPAFLVSSENAWTIETYMEKNKVPNVATDKRRARYELSDLIFKRAPGGKLKENAIARKALRVNNKHSPSGGEIVLWASRAFPEDVDIASAASRDTTFYAFVGTYSSAGRTIQATESDPNPAEIVNERGRYERAAEDPKKSVEAYDDITKNLRKITPDARKEEVLAGLDALEDEIKGLLKGTSKITKANAQAIRKKLANWVLDRFTAIDDFFWLIQAKGFPETSWNPIKGDIQTRFIADLAKTAGVTAEARQVWFGERTDTKLLKRAESLKKVRRGDGFIKVSDGYHILESKARISAPTDDEVLQMKDYHTIVTGHLPGYLVENGEIKNWPEGQRTFSAVEYYLGMATIPTKDEPLYKVAAPWTVELFKAFGGSEQDAEKSLTAATPKPKGYLIHPNLSGDPAKFTTIQINPPITLPIPKPDQIDQSVKDVPSKQPGATIRQADFKLVQPREAEIASGSITIALDLGGAVKSPGEPAPQPMRPVSREEAKPLKPGGPIIYGRVDNKFDNLKTSIDSFFRNRVTSDVKLTEGGAEGSLTVAPGESCIPGITLGAKVGVSYKAGKLTATGHVDLSNEKRTIKSKIAVSYGASAKQWKITGDVTFTDLIEGLEQITAKFTYDPANDITNIHADRAGIRKTYGGITIKGTATDLDYAINAGAFSGKASLTAELGAFGEAGAEHVTIEANQIKNATLAYKTPTLAYPRTNPALAGTLKGSVTYTAGQKPGDAPIFGGSIEVDAEIRAAPLKKLAKGGKLGVAGKVEIEDGKFVRSTIGTTDTLTLGQHFRIPPFQAEVDENGALTLDFSLEVVDIGPLEDAKVEGLINKDGFKIKGAEVKFTFNEKDKVWGSLRVVYRKDDLTVGGDINVRIKEGLVAHGEALYDNQKETVSAALSIDEIPLLQYKSDPKTLVDFTKQVELVSFYEVIGIYLDVGFVLAFVYNFDVRLSPKVTLDDFSFKTFKFSRAKAVMKLLGELSATLTGTPNIGLGVFIISTKLLRAGGGIEIPIIGRASLALDPPVTIEVVYTPEGGVSAGGTAGLTLLFGVTGAVRPYADYSVLDGTYADKWTGQPLTGFTLLQERPIFTYVVNFGKPLTKDTNPPIPENRQDPPAVPNTARPLTGKAAGQPTPTAAARKPEQVKKPEKKPEADSKGGFDLKGMVGALKSEPKFAKALAILDAAAEVWDAISDFVGAIVNFVRKWVGGAIDLIVGIVRAMGTHNVAEFLKDFLRKRIHPLLFHIVEPLLDAIGKVEQDLYDLFEIELPTSPGGFVDFALTIIKKVLKLALDSFTELVKAIEAMVERAIEGARDFAQYLVNVGRLGVVRRERYIGSETLGLEHDFLVADEYKVDVGGVTRHELSDSVWPSPDKAIGWGLWHALDLLGVTPTTTEINDDTDEAYADYWAPLPVHRRYTLNRQVRGTGAVASGAPAAVAAAARHPGIELPGMIRRHYESALGADLSGIRVHTDSAAAAAAKALDARAYAIGHDIHFDTGEFAPGTPAGDHLLAHELAHAAWSPRAGRQRHGFEIVPPSAVSEQAAEVIARRLAAATI
jgi:hypothetical protein